MATSSGDRAGEPTFQQVGWTYRGKPSSLFGGVYGDGTVFPEGDDFAPVFMLTEDAEARRLAFLASRGGGATSTRPAPTDRPSQPSGQPGPSVPRAPEAVPSLGVGPVTS